MTENSLFTQVIGTLAVLEERLESLHGQARDARHQALLAFYTADDSLTQLSLVRSTFNDMARMLLISVSEVEPTRDDNATNLTACCRCGQQRNCLPDS
jgi:phage shock protein A